MLQQFWLCFIPLFVAIDVLSVIPLFLSLTERMSAGDKKRLVTLATLTAFGISSVFLVGGQWIFQFLGITDNDFRIGGGIVLLVLAITDLLFSSSQEASREPPEMSSVAVVPLGIPLIMGPTALTTIQILTNQYGYLLTMLSLLLNLALVWVAFRHADKVIRVVGKGGAKAFAKVSALFLAAIAVMMIRIGLTNILTAH